MELTSRLRPHAALNGIKAGRLACAAWLGLALLQVSCGVVDHSAAASSNPPITPPIKYLGLGAIDAEREFFESAGDGLVTVLMDPAAPETSAATIDPSGALLITLNPIALALLPVSMQDYHLAKQFGRHYLSFPAHPTSVLKQHYADAYSMRVMIALNSSDTQALEVIDWIRAHPEVGDASHPSNFERADYMEAIVAAFWADPVSVPLPESATGSGLQKGKIGLTDPFGDPVNLFVDFAYKGYLLPGGSDTLNVNAGLHQVDLQSQFTGLLLYSSGIEVSTGGTTLVP